MNIGTFEKEIYEAPESFPQEWIDDPISVPEKELEPV